MTLSTKYEGAWPNRQELKLTLFDRHAHLWEEKHMHWARAAGREYAGDEEALTRFVDFVTMKLIVHSRPGSPPGNAWVPAKEGEKGNDVPSAPTWLHALWDVMTERGPGGSHGCLTTKALDGWAVRRAVADEAFRRAVEVTYNEGDIPAVVAMLKGLYEEAQHRVG